MLMATVALTAALVAYCPQPPNQTTASCECAYNRTALPTRLLPRCLATSLCAPGPERQSITKDGGRSVADSGASIVIVYGFNRSHVRYWYRADPFRSFLNAMRLIVRLLLSLQAVASMLPVHMLVSGERHQGFEAALLRQFAPQLRLLDGDAVGRHRIRIPNWASAFHWGSFAKLAVLSLTQFRRILVLDTDTIVLRNIDHLVHMAAPAFVYRFKCWSYKRPGTSTAGNVPIWEMNSGVMLLQPNEALHARVQALMNSNMTTSRDSGVLKAVHVPSDPSDQSVWRSFFSRVHELPVSYNTFKRTHFASVEEWGFVHVLHDPDVHRSAKIPLASVHGRYVNLTKQAGMQVAEIAASLGVTNRG